MVRKENSQSKLMDTALSSTIIADETIPFNQSCYMLIIVSSPSNQTINVPNTLELAVKLLAFAVSFLLDSGASRVALKLRFWVCSLSEKRLNNFCLSNALWNGMMRSSFRASTTSSFALQTFSSLLLLEYPWSISLFVNFCKGQQWINQSRLL